VSDESRTIGHEYDGIREYDNPLPFWWSAIFVITIVFAAGYWVYYQFGPGQTEQARFAGEWKQHELDVAEAAKHSTLVVTEQLLSDWAHDPDIVAAGRQIFVTNCVGCHLEDGRGKTGANLTDSFQIHGSSRLDLYTTVHDGVLSKGMLAWGEILPPKTVATVAAYATTLRGTNAADGKFPEGARVGAWPDVAP
jgi:cytochrome c oxidase cbb3-type subunit 3